MSQLKGQSDIIGVVLIVLIAVGLVSVAYAFGLPLIEKSQDRAIGERVDAFFSQASANSLPQKIENVANNGGKEQVKLDVNGITVLDQGEDWITFQYRSRVTSIAPGKGWVSLNGEDCPAGAALSAHTGDIGFDTPMIVCAKADEASGGTFDITYKLTSRELEDAQQQNGFKIDLQQHPSSPDRSAGSDVNIIVEFEDRQVQQIGDKTLITTIVKILLV